LNVLAETAGQGQRGGAHAVRDHEDEVALGRGLIVVVIVGDVLNLVLMLQVDGEDDDAGGG
jgi:hypothetical protein